MGGNNVIEKLVKECRIYHGDDLISEEEILKKYLEFFNGQFNKEEKKISFSLHTGSICFDIVAVIAIALGSITYNMISNEDIIESLALGEMVIYKNSRYRWMGTEIRDKKYIVLETDGKGANGKGKKWIPYEANKHLVKPYYGESRNTDRRGIRKKKHDREAFLSWLLNRPVQEIPSEFDVSLVIVTNRKQFMEIAQNVRLVSSDEIEIGLLDIVPAAYYTSSGEQYPIGKNPTKTEAILKITAHISEARRLVLNKHGNKVIGLLAIGTESLVRNGSELSDLVRRKSLKFVHIMGSLRSELSENILELYDEADVFACTKQYLQEHSKSIQNENNLTRELHIQVRNIIKSELHPIIIDQVGWSWEQFAKMKNGILQIRQSNWGDKEEFVLSLYALLNLFNTAVFTMDTMEKAIVDEKINTLVISPRIRLEQMKELSSRAGNMQEICDLITQRLEKQYYELLHTNEKKNRIEKYLQYNFGKKIAIIVPKAYYVDLLNEIYGTTYYWRNVKCITVNRYDLGKSYDNILIVGDLSNKKFDPLRCNAAEGIDILLYPCEERAFIHKKKKSEILTNKINKKQGLNRTEAESVDAIEDQWEEEALQEFLDLDEYIDSMNLYNLKRFVTSSMENGNGTVNTEVQTVGMFITGEQIFFSKNYSPIVYNANTGSVVETMPEKLQAGDILIFVKKDNYTKNVVDFIYEQLIEQKRFNTEVIKATDMANYWKEILREYKEKGDYTYQNIAEQMRKYGSSLQAVTICQWLTEDSHIVGPRKEKTMEQIACLTQDKELMSNVQGYFDACRIVRHQRKEILGWIAKAISDKLTGNHSPKQSVLSIVYDNVDNLSEALELDRVDFLDETVNMPVNLVNRPITETEVLL